MAAQCILVCIAMAASLTIQENRASAEHNPADVHRIDAPRTTHPLMPGIRSESIWDTNWRRTQHDPLATGFSPLSCGMRRAPKVFCELPAVGSLNWLETVRGTSGVPCLLVDDGRLRLVDGEGKVLWTRGSVGSLVTSGNLRGDGGNSALFRAANRLTLLDLADGRLGWQYEFEPAFVNVSAKVADILPDVPGQEAVVVPNYATEGYLLSLAPGDKPEILWKQPVVDPGEFDERADHHGGTFEIDLSRPDQPVIWNIRRFRCRGFDARTGKRLSSLSYEIGGAQRRNYGPMVLGRGKNGDPFACVFGEQVQVHVHAIRLHRDGPNELAWQHYYGEVYKEAPGVTVSSLGVADVNGDGSDEMIYSVRDPARSFRSFVRCRNVESGQVEFELHDHWGAELFSDVGSEPYSGLIAMKAPDGDTPDRGELSIFLFPKAAGPPRLAGKLPSAGAWGPVTVADEHNQNRQLLLRVEEQAGDVRLQRFDIVDGKLTSVASTNASQLVTNPLVSVAEGASHVPLFVSRTGRQFSAIDWKGNAIWSVPLEGGDAHISAADLDHDGRAEIVAAMSDGQMRIYGIGESASLNERASFEHQVGWHSHHPVIDDLAGNGEWNILAAGSDSSGKLVVRSHRPDGSIVWETSLPAVVGELRGVIFNAGKFLSKDSAGVAVSITDRRLIREGTYLLDGPTGKVVWFKGQYKDGYVTMPYRPNGIPTAYDLDGDGSDEIGMDLMSYMAYLRGNDGSFALIQPTSNITTQGCTFAGRLYNTYCPLFKSPQDERPHWLVTAGMGSIGLMNPDPTMGVWKEELGYDAPRNVAIVDVDGDGSLEAGYVPDNQNDFICRNVWTGEIEWKFDLAVGHAASYRHPIGTIISGDFDGDGKGEFFDGQLCIGAEKGHGKLLWRAPCRVNWPIVADFDGDGVGEIAGVQNGRIVVLKAVE